MFHGKMINFHGGFVRFLRRLIDKDTWIRVWYFSKGKDPGELKENISKDDVLPIGLSVALAFLIAYIYSLLFKAIGSNIP